jgi:hypothetical protein
VTDIYKEAVEAAKRGEWRPPPGRFSGFTEDERGVIHFALQQCAQRIMDKAAADQYPQEHLLDAGGMFHLASTLASELGVALGLDPANAETLEMVAVCIAEGEAPFAARMAAEAEDEPRGVVVPLGNSAHIPVTPEEDEAA